MSRGRQDHPRRCCATWICICGHACPRFSLCIPIFIEVRSRVSEPQGIEILFALSHFFGYWFLRQLLLPYNPWLIYVLCSASSQTDTRRVAACSVSANTLQYRLGERFHTGILGGWQLFTYLLVHKLFSSCIWRYLMSRACDWVMSALSAVLLIFRRQIILLFSIWVVRHWQHCAVLVLIRNIGHWTLPKIWVRTFLVRNVLFRERLWIYSNGENGN